ncbi:MAG: haloacid dehalogenase type II [Dehalococcoidia bacterium]
MTSDLREIRALTFDVFGTVVDWRTSVIAQCAEHPKLRHLPIDWPAFVDDWRYDGYMRGSLMVRRGELPAMTADQLHLRKLDQLIAQHGIALSEAETDELNRAWHRLEPWPDSVLGLTRLKAKFVVSTLSNGNVSLLVDMAKHAGLPWDCILAADITGAFKPEPQCYQRGAEILGLRTDQVLMVAAHKADLLAAAKTGMRTAFIPRPLEAGPDRKVDLTPDPSFDLVAPDFRALADALSCP